MTPLEQQVIWMLRGAPYTLGALASHLRVPRRSVEEAVQSLRLKGEPIVGGNDGLRLVTDPAELDAYIAARRRRGVSEYLGTRALRQTARRLKEAQDADEGLTLFGTAA